MPAHTGRLLLTTQDPFQASPADALKEGLAAAGFLGDPLPATTNAYAVGPSFLQLLTFAGCSVQINLSPECDSPFCHVRLLGPYPRPLFAWGRNTRPPRCRTCRAQLVDWRKQISRWESGEADTLECRACAAAAAPWELDWKESAGFGRLFLAVEEVFPGEAAPTPSLMQLLAEIAGVPWRYFYMQDP